MPTPRFFMVHISRTSSTRRSARRMTNPGMREQLQNEGAMPVGNSAAEFAAFVRDDVQRRAPIVKQLGGGPRSS
jgi:tripartite-type tricarboxylate transporter receptor subunit TctC